MQDEAFEIMNTFLQQFEQIVSYNEKYRDAAEHLANCRAGL